MPHIIMVTLKCDHQTDFTFRNQIKKEAETVRSDTHTHKMVVIESKNILHFEESNIQFWMAILGQ